jgi:hypothetical protein
MTKNTFQHTNASVINLRNIPVLINIIAKILDQVDDHGKIGQVIWIPSVTDRMNLPEMRLPAVFEPKIRFSRIFTQP